MLLDLHLLRQNVVSNLFSTFPKVRSLPEHALKSYNSNSKIVNSDTMILPTHNFWRHVTRSTACIFLVIRSPYSGDSKICQAQITIVLKN